MTLSVRSIEDRNTRALVYRMRYRAYAAQGLLPHHADGQFQDHYDDLPNHTLVGAFDDGKLVGSIRTMCYDPRFELPIPETDTYRNELDATVGREAIVVSGNRFVRDPAYRGNERQLLLLLLRYQMLCAKRYGCVWALAAVRVPHIKFYERALLARPISEPRRFPGLLAEMVLMATHFPSSYPKVLERHPWARPPTD